MGKSSELRPKIDRVSPFERNSEFEAMGFDTRCVDVGNYSGRSAMPIYASVTGSDYQRHGDPSRDAVSACIASLENAKYTLVTASGVASMTLPMLALLKSGDRIICHKDLYIWTYFFVREDLPRLANIRVDMVDFTDLEALEAALKEEKTAMVVFETIANPLLNVADIKAVSDLAHAHGSLVLVDNTFASPYLCRPLELGADISSESMTKYMNGHGDALAGSISTNSHEIYYELQKMMGVIGCCLSPFNSFLVARGLQTLSLRMEKHCDNAERIVEYLGSKPFVKDLTYPGMETHPQHETAKKQLKRYGGVVCFRLDTSHEKLYGEFLPALKLWKHWVSLGEPHSLISPKDEDKEKGIPADFIRLAVGLENCEDLIADMESAFDKLFASP